MTDPLLQQALAHIGLRRNGPISVLPAGPGRVHRTVLWVPVLDIDGRRSIVVLKLVNSPRSPEESALTWEHRVGRSLHEIAEGLRAGVIEYNPIPALLHELPLRLHPQTEVGERTGQDGVVMSIQAYVETTSTLTPRTWGQLIGMLHVVGSTPQALSLLRERAGNALFGLDAEHLLRAVRSPAHPYQRQSRTLARLVEALRERVIQAIDADPVPLLVHRDLHPLNIVAGAQGPVALDWGEAGWGSRSDDFAWLHVAVTRFGAPPSVLQEARAGYEDVMPDRCPSIEAIRAAGQVRELICLAFSIQNAALSPAHQREARVELPILDDPDALTPSWTPLFNPAAFTHPCLGSDLRRWVS
jgi:hypothetical protein